jgi:hypothetical protein
LLVKDIQVETEMVMLILVAEVVVQVEQEQELVTQLILLVEMVEMEFNPQ